MEHYRLSDIPQEPVSHDPSLQKKVMVPGGMLPGIRSFSHIVLPAGAHVDEHSHTEGYEVFYCIRGTIDFTVAGQRVLFSAGECLVAEPGEAHALDVREETEMVYFFVLKE
jgi:quercetin dioxygenase-like cupin family protein